MAYDTLVREAKDLPEDMIEQVIDFMRFLKYASKKEPTKHSTNNDAIFRRTVTTIHGNPFDRLIISQAILENLVIITKDGTIPMYRRLSRLIISKDSR